MGVVITGFVGSISDFTIQETGEKGATINVVDMGQDINVSTRDSGLLAVLKDLQARCAGQPQFSVAVRVPVTLRLSTYGGTAKIKYSLADKPQVVQPAPTGR